MEQIIFTTDSSMVLAELLRGVRHEQLFIVADKHTVGFCDKLLEKVDYPPQFGKYKVYIIDEVHMLSPAAYNALLKTIEEPPSHAVFILATMVLKLAARTFVSTWFVLNISSISSTT